eukprot:3925259-Rhodomonas_salina.1
MCIRDRERSACAVRGVSAAPPRRDHPERFEHLSPRGRPRPVPLAPLQQRPLRLVDREVAVRTPRAQRPFQVLLPLLSRARLLLRWLLTLGRGEVFKVLAGRTGRGHPGPEVLEEGLRVSVLSRLEVSE